MRRFRECRPPGTSKTVRFLRLLASSINIHCIKSGENAEGGSESEELVKEAYFCGELCYPGAEERHDAFHVGAVLRDSMTTDCLLWTMYDSRPRDIMH